MFIEYTASAAREALHSHRMLNERPPPDWAWWQVELLSIARVAAEAVFLLLLLSLTITLVPSMDEDLCALLQRNTDTGRLLQLVSAQPINPLRWLLGRLPWR